MRTSDKALTEKFGMPSNGVYKVITVSNLGQVTETYYSGWNAETAADSEWRSAKGNKRIRYTVIFVGRPGGVEIRWEYPKLETEK